MKHAVVGPARYLMGAYLALPRIRSLADIASGLFVCSLFLEASLVLLPRWWSLIQMYSTSEIQSGLCLRLSIYSSTPCSCSPQPPSRTRAQSLVPSPPRILVPITRRVSGSEQRRPEDCNPGNLPCSRSSMVMGTSRQKSIFLPYPWISLAASQKCTNPWTPLSRYALLSDGPARGYRYGRP